MEIHNSFLMKNDIENSSLPFAYRQQIISKPYSFSVPFKPRSLCDCRRKSSELSNSIKLKLTPPKYPSKIIAKYGFKYSQFPIKRLDDSIKKTYYYRPIFQQRLVPVLKYNQYSQELKSLVKENAICQYSDKESMHNRSCDIIKNNRKIILSKVALANYNDVNCDNQSDSSDESISLRKKLK